MNSKRNDDEGDGNTTLDFRKGDADDDICYSTSIGSISEDSMNSVSLSSSSESTEEANSSTPSSSISHSNGPLYELSQLMNHLPVKRGLSMFYKGKAQSFTSLARIQSIEDLPKKATHYRKKMESSKSYGGNLDTHKILHYPKATISKKSSRGSLVSALSKRGSFLGGSRSSSITVQKDF